LFLVCVQR